MLRTWALLSRPLASLSYSYDPDCFKNCSKKWSLQSHRAVQPIASWERRGKRMDHKLQWLHTPREYPRQPEQHQTQSAPVRLLTCGRVCVVYIHSPLGIEVASHSDRILVRPALQLNMDRKKHTIWSSARPRFQTLQLDGNAGFSGYTYSFHFSVF